MLKVLVACEESQTVTIAARQAGHEAYSCDLLPCSGGYPEWHFQQNVIPLLKKDWDIILAFPPCDHLASSGARWFKEKRQDGRQQQGIDFFMQFTKVDCPKVVIENPVGIMSTIYRKPDQIIQPFWFGDMARKSTCLWLKGLPKLVPTKFVEAGEDVIHGGRKLQKWYSNAGKDRKQIRSKTFEGVAKAMVEQWMGSAS